MFCNYNFNPRVHRKISFSKDIKNTWRRKHHSELLDNFQKSSKDPLRSSIFTNLDCKEEIYFSRYCFQKIISDARLCQILETEDKICENKTNEQIKNNPI